MICFTDAELAKAAAFIESNDVIAYDTETTGLNTRKDTVIGFSFGNEAEAYYIPLHVYNGTVLAPTNINAEPFLNSLLAKKLVMWNATFDVLITKQSLGFDLLPALHADAMLVKHTCDENYPFGLKEVAAQLYGEEVTNEKEEMLASIKANGGKAKEYYKADVSILGRYACQDAMLTMRLFNHYDRKLSELGLQAFYYDSEVHPLLKTITIPMVERGVRVDVAALISAQVEIKTDLEQLEARIQETIAPNLGIFTRWFLNKDYPLQTATGKQPKWAKDGLTQEQAWRRDAGPEAYMFNLQSKFHLKKLFFDTLKLTPLSRTPTGMPQVDDEFLTTLHTELPWTALLSDYNRLTKLKGTYIDRLLEEQEDGRFYPEWKQHATVSGRYGGDMQQLPRPLDPGAASEIVTTHTNRIRSFIIADAGSKLCSADYEQLEPSIFAHCSGDKRLQVVFNSGADFYSTVAIDTEGLKEVSADKKAPNYLGKVNKAARQKAKAYALGIAYGMTGYKLQFEIGVSQDEAEALVSKYLAAYPDLAAWMDNSKNTAITAGRVTTQAGRQRNLGAAKALAGKYGPGLSNSLELWKRYTASPALYEKAKADRKIYINQLNNAINFQIQGLAASVVNRAAIAIANKLKTEQLKSYVTLQIHDEIVLNVPEAEIAIVGPMVKQIMQEIVTLAVPLRTEPQFGFTFKDCK